MYKMDNRMPKKIFVEKSNLLIPKNLRAEYDKIKTPKDSFVFLSRTDIVMNDNFYIIFDNVIKKISKDNHIETYQLALGYMDSVIDALIPISPIHRALSSFYQMILYPLFIKSYKTPKKLSEFNINVNFIKNIMLTNLRNLRVNEYMENGDDVTLKLFYFKFNSKIQLVEFETMRSGGIRQVYNKDYNIKSIIMADGEEIKVPKKILLENHIGNKRISKFSKSNSSI